MSTVPVSRAVEEKKSFADLIEDERRKKVAKANELEQRQMLNKVKQERRDLEKQILKEKYARVISGAKATSQAVRQAAVAASPYAKEAYKEINPAVKQAAKSIASGALAYIKYVANSTPSSATFILTNRGRKAIEAYYAGDYNIIPEGSVRAQLLHIARTHGAFKVGGAISMFGDNGVAASQILAEQGLIVRSI